MGDGSQRRIVVPAIDGFRGFAALTVLVYHSFYFAGLPALGDGTLRAVIAAGYLGVDYFFVISGFVLFLPTVLNDGSFGSVRSYAVRRAARILPPYYLFLLVVVVGYQWLSPTPTPLPLTSAKGSLSGLLHLIFLQHNVGLLAFPGGVGVMPEGFGVVTVVWTLSLEVLFYVALPLVAGRYYRHPFIGFAVALAISVLWRLGATNVDVSLAWLGSGGWSVRTIYPLQVVLVTQFPNYLAHFAAGMTAAWMFVRLRRAWTPAKALRVALPLQVVSLIVLILAMRHEGTLVLTHPGPYHSWARTTPIAVVFACLLLFTALSTSWGQWPVVNPVSRWLGDVSYGVYLSHLIVIALAITTLGVVATPGHTDLGRLLAIVVPGSLLAGWLSWVLVERPARSWARRHSQRPGPGGDRPAPTRPEPTAVAGDAEPA